MKRYNKPLLALLVGALSMAGAAGLAQARPGGHYGAGGPCYQAAQVTPEMQQMMEKAYNDIAPLIMELRAKQDELTARIYGGADDKTIKDLTDSVVRLQGRVTEARAALQKQFVKSGVPLHAAGCLGFAPGMRGGCPGMAGAGGMMGHGFGPGMRGGCQGGMMGQGYGHGHGHGYMPAPAPGAAQ